MSKLMKMTWVEAKLFGRDPLTGSSPSPSR